jgi:fumarate hydratase subunit beta
VKKVTKKLSTPLTDETVEALKAGERVLFNGIIYTGRDAAHKRLADMMERGEKLPMDLKGQVIYYVGPCPAKPGQAIGSAGPTTSGRMDSFAPQFLHKGLKGMIGKGIRSKGVIDSIVKNKAVYFAAIGGAGALLAEAVKEAEIVAFEDLGPEAVYRLRVEDFPAIVIIDCHGDNLYETEPKKFRTNK